MPLDLVTELDDNQIEDIAKCDIPHDWQTQMHQQNFDASEKTLDEFIGLNRLKPCKMRQTERATHRRQGGWAGEKSV